MTLSLDINRDHTLTESGPLDSETLLAAACSFLVEGSEDDAALMLLLCNTAELIRIYTYWSETECADIETVDVVLVGPRAVYDAIKGDDFGNPTAIYEQLRNAFNAILPIHTTVRNLKAQVMLRSADEGWRIELLELAKGRLVHNQASTETQPLLYKNLRFRSASEIKIAEALDRAKVFYLPNCRGRLNLGEGRVNREADFLICKDGKWGILEVDGEAFHPASRTTEDHDRDRLFRNHGVRITEHFDAMACFRTPDKIVAAFLALLAQS